MPSGTDLVSFPVSTVLLTDSLGPHESALVFFLNLIRLPSGFILLVLGGFRVSATGPYGYEYRSGILKKL